jgi:DNA modification methylase
MTIELRSGDCRDVLATLPANSVQCVVTSPPYYGLRDYGCAGQIGLEPTPDAYLATMVAVFREVRRVLRPDGTCWVNMGDSYNTYPGNRGSSKSLSAATNGAIPSAPKGYGLTTTTLANKQLLMMPARLALALQADGWWLRSAIVWAKPNPMPESVSDRPTSAYEMVYLLTKAARYFYDADAVREVEAVPNWDNGTRIFGGINKHGANLSHGERTTGRLATARVKVPGGWDQGDGAHGTIHRDGRTSAEYQDAPAKAGRNLRNVWTIATAPYSDAHFATFPPTLAERCIKAGTTPPTPRWRCSAAGTMRRCWLTCRRPLTLRTRVWRICLGTWRHDRVAGGADHAAVVGAGVRRDLGGGGGDGAISDGWDELFGGCDAGRR